MEKAKKIPYYGGVALLAYMPFHIFLSQWLSTFTGGLEAWKVAKDVLTMALVIVSVGLVIWTKAYRRLDYWRLALLALLYLLLHIGLYFVNKETSMEVAALATVYNNRLFWYLIIGLSAVLLTPEKFNRQALIKLIIIVSTITCLLGLLQYALPKDIMEHFGYSVERGVKPSFFIDDKPDLPRIMSTVRDPNSFGAYLVVPLTIIWAQLLGLQGVRSNKQKASRAFTLNSLPPALKAKRQLLVGLFMLHGLALFLTFSRGAWLAAGLSLMLVTAIMQRRLLLGWLKRFWPIILVLILVLFSSLYLLRDQYVVQNIIFHSDETTKAKHDSNELHLLLAKQGIEEFTNNPLGDGPGTAGIVSIQNDGKGLLTENYYIQILHEAGVIGLGILLAFWAFVARRLKPSDTLGAALLASGAGYAALCMIMHLWTNEAVAAQWWLLSGAAIAWGSSAAGRDKAKRRARG